MTMTAETLAALALAVHVRNRALEAKDDPYTLGDGFPLEDWRDWYAHALRWAGTGCSADDDPAHAVHQICGRLREIRAVPSAMVDPITGKLKHDSPNPKDGR